LRDRELNVTVILIESAVSLAKISVSSQYFASQ